MQIEGMRTIEQKNTERYNRRELKNKENLKLTEIMGEGRGGKRKEI